MADIESSGFPEVDRLIELVGRTRTLLDAVLEEGQLPGAGADFLAETTLPHLESVQAGFHGWLRADAANLAELQYLLAQVGWFRVDPARTPADRAAAAAEALVERALAARQRPALRGARPWDLAALSHARLVLATLPRLPDDAVRYPAGRRTYSDISAPRGPAELAERIAELERELWWTATGRPSGRTDPGFRRTYGFFDVAERLGRRAFGLAG